MAKTSLDTRVMIDRYRWWELLASYAGLFVFLFFLLSPFTEGFLVSLKPLAQLFSSPYSFWPKNGSFTAHFTMWDTVPGFARYVFNSFLISITSPGLCCTNRLTTGVPVFPDRLIP